MAAGPRRVKNYMLEQHVPQIWAREKQRFELFMVKRQDRLVRCFGIHRSV